MTQNSIYHDLKEFGNILLVSYMNHLTDFSLNNQFFNILVGGPMYEVITNAIAEMVAIDGQPDAIVERRGFKRLFKRVVPRYQMVVRRTVIIGFIYQ